MIQKVAASRRIHCQKTGYATWMQSIVRRFIKDLAMDMDDLARQLEAENRQSKAESDAFYDAYFTQMMLRDSFRSPWLWAAVASGGVIGALITAVVLNVI